MKKFNVEDLKEGMVFNKPIYYDKNNLFIEQNTPVTKDNVKQLMKWGISFVETDGTLVKRANNSKEEVVVELLEAAVPIPITVKMDAVRVIRRESEEGEEK